MTDTSKPAVAAVVERLRTKASMIMLGEPIAWGSDSAVMDEAASLISALEAERDDARSRLKEESREAFVGRKIVGQQKSLMLEAAAAINETLTRLEAAEALNATLQAKLEKAADALEWYGEQARLARLMHSGGDAGRHALQDDGGKRARSTLSTLREASDA